MNSPTRPLTGISASVVYLLERTPLLSSFPATIKQEIGDEIQRLAMTSDLKPDMDHDASGFHYGLAKALRKMPVFSVYSTEAAENMVYNIVDICFDEAVQRKIKIDRLTHAEA